MAYDFTRPTQALGTRSANSGSSTPPAYAPPDVPLDKMEPMVSTALEALTNHISELQIELDGLQRQLEPVLLPIAPQAGEGASTPSPSHGVVVDTLEGFTARIAGIKFQMFEIKRRLTV